jgi:hypothetical protein
VRKLREHFHGADGQLLQAFNQSVEEKWKAANLTEFDRNLRALCEHSPTPAFPLFDTVSRLVVGSPAAAKNGVITAAIIHTQTPNELLIVDQSGNWQVAWLCEDGSDEEMPALRWYSPVSPERTPITPQPVIDYVAGCVSLYRAGLSLPSLAVLTMAYEAALWDALGVKGIARSARRIEYQPVKWKLKRVSDKVVVEVNGADKKVTELLKVPGQHFEEVEVRVTSAGSSQTMATLAVQISSSNMPFLATTSIASEEVVTSRGLRNAVELARSQNISAISVIPKPLDDTFIAIRNNLVHFPANGKLDSPIPMLGQSDITDIAALASDRSLFIKLLLPVVAVINETYEDPILSVPVALSSAPTTTATTP